MLPWLGVEVEKVPRLRPLPGYHKYSWSIITEDWSYIHWLRDDERTVNDSMRRIYGDGIIEVSSDVKAVQDDPLWKIKEISNTALNEEQRKFQEAATLDGEDQWTCTPGSVASVPERDELYDRRKDPKQLHDVAAEHPDVAAELLQKLRLFIQELRAS